MASQGRETSSRRPSRAELQALARPSTARRYAWGFGALAIWISTTAIGAFVNGSPVVGAVALASAVFSAVWCFLAIRSIRRMPETQLWIDENHPEA